jgi:hypothetical protein
MKILRIFAIIAAIGPLTGGPALAAPTAGNTSGPAVGTHVDPPTAVEKQNPGNNMRDNEALTDQTEDGSMAVGSPGVEGSPGTQSGPPPAGAK